MYMYCWTVQYYCSVSIFLMYMYTLTYYIRQLLLPAYPCKYVQYVCVPSICCFCLWLDMYCLPHFFADFPISFFLLRPLVASTFGFPWVLFATSLGLVRLLHHCKCGSRLYSIPIWYPISTVQLCKYTAICCNVVLISVSPSD